MDRTRKLNTSLESEGAPNGAATGWSRYLAKASLSLLIGGVFVLLLSKGALPVLPSGRAAFERVRWGYVALAGTSWLAGHILRAGRWYWLLAPVRKIRFRTVFPLSFVGFAAVVALPLRMGEIVRLFFIGRTTGLSAWNIAGAVGAERVMDGLTLSSMLAYGLLVARPMEPLPDHIGELAVPTKIVPHAAWVALVGFFCAFVAMAVFYARRDWARRVTVSVVGVLSIKLAKKIADKLSLVSDGLGFLANARVLVPFAAITVGYWVASAGTFWCLARGTGLSSMPFAEATVVMGTLALGILLPAAPGYFGAFQLSVYAALALYHPSRDVVGQGALFVFLLYLLQVGAQLVIGAGSLLVGMGKIAGPSPRPADVT
jgi:uncharacterized protein (TIRG00374 family)